MSYSLKAWIILKHTQTNMYHPAFFKEIPMPISTPSFLEPNIIQLMSTFHHTEGFNDLNDAVKEIHKNKCGIFDENICDEPIKWDGEIGIKIILNDWRGWDSICDSLHERK